MGQEWPVKKSSSYQTSYSKYSQFIYQSCINNNQPFYADSTTAIKSREIPVAWKRIPYYSIGFHHDPKEIS